MFNICTYCVFTLCGRLTSTTSTSEVIVHGWTFFTAASTYPWLTVTLASVWVTVVVNTTSKMTIAWFGSIEIICGQRKHTCKTGGFICSTQPVGRISVNTELLTIVLVLSPCTHKTQYILPLMIVARRLSPPWLHPLLGQTKNKFVSRGALT